MPLYSVRYAENFNINIKKGCRRAHISDLQSICVSWVAKKKRRDTDRARTRWPCNVLNVRNSVSSRCSNTARRVEKRGAAGFFFNPLQGVWIAVKTPFQVS